MTAFQSNLSSFIASNTDYVTQTVRERKLAFGLLGYLTGAFCTVFFANIQSGSSILAFIAQVVVYFLLFVMAGLFFSAITQWFLDLTTKQGNGPGLFALIGLSEFIKTLLLAGALISGAVKGGAALNSVVLLTVLILQLCFLVSMVSRSYETQKGIVFFSFALTFVPSLVAFVTMVLLLVAGFVGLIMGLS